MFANNILLAYPELIAVALLALVLVNRRDNEETAQGDNVLYQVANSVLRFLPERYQIWLAQRQVWAGMRTRQSTSDFAACKLMLFGGVLLLLLFLPIPVVLPLAVMGYFVPDAFLLIGVQRRRAQIRESLPQALDLMVMCVDAGLGLDATLQRISGDQSVSSNALSEELTALGRDIVLGMDRARAYQEMYRRSGVEELKMLGSALNQSTKLGLSIARILRAQAEFLRARQSQAAEEKASKLPVWMAFPLWFCIMPALLFVIMGPTFITFISNIGHVRPEWFN